MEIVIRAVVMFAFLWGVTRAVGRSTLGELSTFQLLLYVTMGDLVQQSITQQDGGDDQLDVIYQAEREKSLA